MHIAYYLLTVNPGFSNQSKAVNLLDRVTELKILILIILIY